MSIHQSVVYFMLEELPRPSRKGLIKIGVSTNLSLRRQTMRDMYKKRVRLLAVFPGTRKDEQKMHDQFSSVRVENEWFRPCAALQSKIDEIAATEFSKTFLSEIIFPSAISIQCFSPEEARILSLTRDLAYLHRCSVRELILDLIKKEIDKQQVGLKIMAEARHESLFIS